MPGGGRSVSASKRLFSNGGSSGKSDLTKSENDVKLDSNGVPFKYPEVHIDDKKEYAAFMDQVGLRYEKYYEGNEFCHITFTNKTYLFENHGRGDYNIYRILED